jgi:hypothetical protein
MLLRGEVDAKTVIGGEVKGQKGALTISSAGSDPED